MSCGNGWPLLNEQLAGEMNDATEVNWGPGVGETSDCEGEEPQKGPALLSEWTRQRGELGSMETKIEPGAVSRLIGLRKRLITR
jgi:hypothetical protein